MPDRMRPCAGLSAQGPAKPMTAVSSTPSAMKIAAASSNTMGLWLPAAQELLAELYSASVLTLPSLTPVIAPVRS